MRDWLVATTLAIASRISPRLFHSLVRCRVLRRIEDELLWRKFGDIPMFRRYLN